MNMYEGVTITLDEKMMPVILTTPGLRMAIDDVVSDQASSLTDDQWDAESEYGDDEEPEVPPDGIPSELGFDIRIFIKAQQRPVLCLDCKTQQVLIRIK